MKKGSAVGEDYSETSGPTNSKVGRKQNIKFDLTTLRFQFERNTPRSLKPKPRTSGSCRQCLLRCTHPHSLYAIRSLTTLLKCSITSSPCCFGSKNGREITAACWAVGFHFPRRRCYPASLRLAGCNHVCQARRRFMPLCRAKRQAPPS